MKRRWFAYLGVLLLGSLHAEAPPPQIAIIIDDLGYTQSAGQRAIALPGAITYAILPNAPGSSSLAMTAYASGKEVILHLPLQAMDDDASEHEEIRLDMTVEEFSRAFDRARDSVPHAVGVNNHRGSLITRHPGHMRWLMENIRLKTDWFFVDSRTTSHSVAMQFAHESGVPAIERDVFLDASRLPADIHQAIGRLKRTARREGRAVAIGHPYPETLAALEQAIPELEKEGFELVAVSDLIRMN